MELEGNLAENSTTPTAASTSQLSQDPARDASEDQECPVCWETINDKVYVSWCHHTFCFSCVLEWSRRKLVCPTCQRSFNFLLHNEDNDYATYCIMQRQPSWRSLHLQGLRPSRRDRGTGHAATTERGRSRSLRQQRDGHRTVQHAQDNNTLSSRRRQHRRAQDTDADEAPASSRRRGHLQQGRQPSSRRRQATRSRSQRRSRSAGRQTQRQQRTRRDRRERQAQNRQQQRLAYSTERQATRSRSRHRSRSTQRQTPWEQ